MNELESFTDLISQAIAMLKDRSRIEGDLIYAIAKMTDEERSAICFAYKILYEKDK